MHILDAIILGAIAIAAAASLGRIAARTEHLVRSHGEILEQLKKMNSKPTEITLQINGAKFGPFKMQAQEKPPETKVN
jgi:hypothetical protein